jgi:hypothetical protein
MDFTFDAKDVRVLIDMPTQAFAEYVAHPAAAATGRRVDHLLMGRIVVENGEIKLLREAAEHGGYGTGTAPRRRRRPAGTRHGDQLLLRQQVQELRQHEDLSDPRLVRFEMPLPQTRSPT